MAVAWCDYNGLILNVVTKLCSAKTTIESAADIASGISCPSGFPLAGTVANIPGEIRECVTEIGDVKDILNTQALSWARAEGESLSVINALEALFEMLEEQPEIFEKFRNIMPKNNSTIAHRGYRVGNIGDNCAEGFILAGENGFWGCEADVRFDEDGNLVCSHNTVQNNQDVTSFEEYLDICKKYGMTAIIDIKYEKGVGPADENLSPAILDVIKEKGMENSCVLQTNNYTDIPYIRENSKDARIWYLTDSLSDKNMDLIEDNNVECVNILSSEYNTYKINKLKEQGVDVCVWNVQTQNLKDIVLDTGAKYVMTDNILDTTPYQEGEEDFNNVNNNYINQFIEGLEKGGISSTSGVTTRTTVTSPRQVTINTSGVTPRTTTVTSPRQVTINTSGVTSRTTTVTSPRQVTINTSGVTVTINTSGVTSRTTTVTSPRQVTINTSGVTPRTTVTSPRQVTINTSGATSRQVTVGTSGVTPKTTVTPPRQVTINTSGIEKETIISTEQVDVTEPTSVGISNVSMGQSNPSITVPEHSETIIKCTPEAILKAAQTIENADNVSNYVCNILYLSGYYTKNEIDIYQNSEILEIFEYLEKKGWEKITNYSKLKEGDIIIINNGKEIRIYAGSNRWYSSGDAEIKQGDENWAENINWFAYRPK